MSYATIGPKDIAESKIVEFPFGSEMGSGEAIASATVTITVVTGTDAAPGTMLIGLPVTAGTSVLQRVAGGVVGVTYHIKATVTSTTGSVHAVAANLPVVSL